MTDLDRSLGGRDAAVTIDTTSGEAQLRWNPAVAGFEVALRPADGVTGPWHGPFSDLDALGTATGLSFPKRATQFLEADRTAEPGHREPTGDAPRRVDVGTPSGLIAYRDGRVERFRAETVGVYVGMFDTSGQARIVFEDGKRATPVRHVVIDSPDGLAWGYDGAGPRDAGYAVLRHELARAKPGAANLDDVTSAHSRLFTTEVVRPLVPNEAFRLSADIVRTWAGDRELIGQLRTPEQEANRLRAAKVAQVARDALLLEPAVDLADVAGRSAPLGAVDTVRSVGALDAVATSTPVLLAESGPATDRSSTIVAGVVDRSLRTGGRAVVDLEPRQVLDGAGLLGADRRESAGIVGSGSQRGGVDATPLRDQLIMIGTLERSSPVALAQGLGLEPRFVERVLSREQVLLDVGEVRAVCEGLHCDPDDLWPPVVVEEQILPEYPVEQWPPYRDRIEAPLGVKLAVSSVAWTAGIAMVQRVSGESLASVVPLVQLGTNQPHLVPLITDIVNVVQREVTAELGKEERSRATRDQQRGVEKASPSLDANRVLDRTTDGREARA